MRAESTIYDAIRRHVEMVIMPQYFDSVHIISGGCPTGADHFAEKYARDYELDFTKYPAKWNRYGKRAGPIRNTKIAKEADILIAFPHPEGKGTQDTIRKFEQYHPSGTMMVL